MVTLIKYGALSGGEKYNVNQMYIDGLSTDAKPTTTIDGMSIPNGSVFTELDTGKEFLFDYDNATWYEVQTGGGGGGGGGTSNYNDLSNRPSVNNTVLTGNKTSAQLGLASSEQGSKADTAIQGIKVNGSTVNPDANKVVNITVPTTAVDVSALPNTTKYAAALSLTINSSTFVMTGQLKDQNGDNLGTAQTIDLPLESVVVNGSYDSQTKKVVLTLQNGNTIEFSVADLVSGLQTELSASNKLNPAYIDYDSTHRAVSDTEKSTWNSKQNTIDSSHKLSADLVDDTSTTNKFATAAELEQIETNKNNILTVANQTTRYNILNNIATSKTENNVTLTVNADKTVTVSTSGAASATTFIELTDGWELASKYVDCTVSGAAIGSDNNACIYVAYSNNGSTEAVSSRVHEQQPTALVSSNYTYIRVLVIVIADKTISEPITFYPMITPTSLYNAGFTNYQPYAMSNAELTAAIQALQAQLNQ